MLHATACLAMCCTWAACPQDVPHSSLLIPRRYIAGQTDRHIRFVGLSTALANAQVWRLSRSQVHDFFSISHSLRPQPTETQTTQPIVYCLIQFQHKQCHDQLH